MSLFNKNWKFYEPASREFLELHTQYSNATKQILWNKNLKKKEQSKLFFNPDYNTDTHDPYLLKNIKPCVDRIKIAIKNNENIIIYGDYDVDGVCGVTLLKEVFENLGAKNLTIYIPHREDEGYGLNKKAIDIFIRNNAQLIVTVDCGSTNISEIEYAQKNNIDVIVIDHHQMPKEKNPCFALVNPHQEGDNYPFKNLCGTAVAFKVSQILLNNKKQEKWLLDLVALATVCDVMPLVNENRVLVKYGLLVLAQTKRHGLQALMRSAGIAPTYDRKNLKTNLKAFTLGFILGPRLNAAGRMAHANLAFDVLNSKTKYEAQELVQILENKNKERKKLVFNILEEINHSKFKKEHAIFIGKSSWPIGVLGIVAGRLSEQYNKPAFVYQKKGGILVGSARAPQHINIVEALASQNEVLKRFGGHKQAGGFTADIANENLLREGINTHVAELIEGISEKELQTQLNIDSEIIFEEINWYLYDELEQFEPFGEANSKPILYLKNAIINYPKMVGYNAKHFKCTVSGENSNNYLNAIGFNFAENAQNIKHGDKVDILFELDKNQWNGKRELSLKLVDIRR